MGRLSSTPKQDPLGDQLRAARQTEETLEIKQALAQTRAELLDRSAPVLLSRYVLLGPLGRGGLGVVYRAYDPALEREVAIKLLRPGVRTEDASTRRARLEREAQAIAQLSHPNVIAVHDVGVYDERDLSGETGGDERLGVFVVMELVEGPTLREWLAQQTRTWREVQEVFVAAGRGLLAAHERGIIHRDFKPSNVLVGDRVRVVDFGLARTSEANGGTGRAPPGVGPRPARHSDDPASGLSSPLTEHGLIIGTPPYMAPEQHRGRPTDARTDQYSFCLALYEGFFGSRPFDTTDVERLARLKEAGVQKWPARERGGPPDALVSVVRRGLRPDPAERYPSMADLLAELEPDPLARRRRIVVGLGIAGGLASVAAMSVAWRAHLEQQCRGFEQQLAGVWDDERKAAIESAFLATKTPYAGTTAAHVDEQLSAYARRWVDTAARVCRQAVFEGSRDEAWHQQALGCLDERLRLLGSLADLLGQTDKVIVDSAPDLLAVLADVERCEQIDPGAFAAEPQRREAAVDLRIQLGRAETLVVLGRFEEARAIAGQVLERARDGGDHALEATTLRVLGTGLRRSGEHAYALERQYESWSAAERAGDDRTVIAALIELMELLSGELDRPDEAARLGEIAEARLERRPLGDLVAAELAYAASRVLFLEGEYVLAEEQAHASLDRFRRSVGDQNPRVVEALTMLGRIRLLREAKDEASGPLEEALQICVAALGREHPRCTGPLIYLLELEQARGELDEAIRYAQWAVATLEGSHGPEHVGLAPILLRWGDVRLATGDVAGGVHLLERAVAVYQKNLGAGHRNVALARIRLAQGLSSAGRTSEAEAEAGRALAITRANEDLAVHPITADIQIQRGQVLLSAGKPSEALSAFEEAERIYEGSDDADRVRVGWALAGSGQARLALDQREQAVDDLERARELLAELGDTQLIAAQVEFVLATAIDEDEPERARSLAHGAYRVVKRFRPASSHADQMKAWLRERGVSVD